MSQNKPSIALTDAYELFMLDNQARRFTPPTLTFYRSRLGHFITWCNTRAVHTLSDITPAIIRAHLVSLQKRELSDYSQHAAARAIRAFLNFCVREELLAESPMKKVSMPKVDKKILPSFSLGEVKKLLQTCVNERDEAIVLFLLDTGLRASEFIKLNGEDINTSTGEVIVHQGKGGKDRTVFLGVKARKKLLRYYIEFKRPAAKQPVWCNLNTGERLTTSGLFQLLRRLGEQAGVENCTAHTFRRTFALWCLRAGMDVYSLQRLMGHADLTTLLRYLGLTKEDLQRAHNEHGAVDNNL